MKRNLRRLLAALVLLAILAAVFPAGTHAQDDDDPCLRFAPPGAPAPYFVGLGDAYFRQGSYTRAIERYDCAIERDPDYAPAYVNRGFAYAAQRNDPLALADYERALALDDTLASAYNNRGILYMNQGNFGLAITDFSLVIAFLPEDATAYHNRAVVHAAEGSYDLAMDDLQQAIALEPEAPAPRAALGMVYSALAMESYREYNRLAGENAFLPAGDPDTVILAIGDGQETGNFAVWLPMLMPAR